MFKITTRRKGELAVDLPVDTVDKSLFEGCSRAFFVNQGVYFYISLAARSMPCRVSLSTGADRRFT